MPQMGEEIHGELRSDDASSGVEIPVYDAGQLTARTIQSDEQLVITDITIITAAGGDTFVNVGADATPSAGEYVERGTFASNGGVDKQYRTPYYGIKGGKPFVTSPAGDVDVQIKGFIKKF